MLLKIELSLGVIEIEEKKLSEASTIYQYKLNKRILIKYEYLAVYISLLVIASILFIVFHNMTQMISLLLGYVLLQVLHTAIISLDFIVRSKFNLRNWAFQLQFPWVGFLPKHPISMQAFTSIHLHILLVGIALIACLFPWASPLFLGNLLFLHLWILLPRFVVILIARLPQTGLIKLNQRNISHYNS